MIPKECRDLLDLYLDTARTTDVEASATASLDAAAGMLGYAIARGDLTPQEHSNEWTIIKLIRAQRRNKINDSRQQVIDEQLEQARLRNAART